MRIGVVIAHCICAMLGSGLRFMCSKYLLRAVLVATFMLEQLLIPLEGFKERIDSGIIWHGFAAPYDTTIIYILCDVSIR